MIFDAPLCNLTGKTNKFKKKKEAENAVEKVTALISLGSPKSNRNKWWGLDKHTLEMPGKQSRKLKESTLIKMLTETLSIYERGLTLRKKEVTFN